jgi:alpha/beta superfamily hydrolase
MPEVMINGPEGRLEGRYHHSTEPNAPIALILHPHPQHGGTMNNKIVYAMFKTFKQLGFCVLRFNFRGVGRSQGSFDDGQGELSDAASVLDWMQTHNPNASACWVAGFSFGAWIGMQVLMRRPEIQGFISVAPPANLYDFAFLAPCPSSGLIIQGDKDDIVPEQDTAGLVKKLQLQKHITIDYRIMKSADHFFENHIDKIAENVKTYVSEAMAPSPE